MKELKYSRQREAVLDCLRKRHDHPTADTIFQTLRQNDPKISLGTVYRNLGLLTELGSITKITCGDGIERYDYKTDEHYHFVCRDCGRIIDLEPNPGETWVDDSMISEHIGVADAHSLIFYGHCTDCLSKHENDNL